MSHSLGGLACRPTPNDADSQGIFNDDTFSKMKKGARIINVARGGVIDEAALVRALDAGIVAQACIGTTLLSHPSALISTGISHLYDSTVQHLASFRLYTRTIP